MDTNTLDTNLFLQKAREQETSGHMFQQNGLLLQSEDAQLALHSLVNIFAFFIMEIATNTFAHLEGM